MLVVNFRSIAVGAFAMIALFSSGLLVVFTPVPLIYVSAFRGRRAGVHTAALAFAGVCALLFFALPTFVQSLESGGLFLPLPAIDLAAFLPMSMTAVLIISSFCFYAAIGIALGEAARRRWGLQYGVAVVLGSGLAVMILAGVVLSAMGFEAGLSGMQRYFLSIVAELVRLQQDGGAAGLPIALLADHGDAVAAFVLRIIPGMLFLYGVMVVMLNFLVGRRLTRNVHAFSHIHNAARFRLPFPVVWVLIGAGITFFAGHYVLHSVSFEMLAINVLIGVSALYFLQGMSVVVYMLQGVRAPFMRAAVYIAIIMFFQTVSVGLVALGIVDSWVDFRLRRWRARHHST